MKSCHSISTLFDQYLIEIMPIVEKFAIQPKYGYHGLYTHTAAVVFRGIDYVIHIEKPTTPVILACAFHDMARTNDDYDLEHGANAIPLANYVMDEIGGIDTATRNSILYAVKNHSINTKPNDYIHACLDDADRTRLAWECGYFAKYFTTPRAHSVASGNAEAYLKFMQNNMSGYARTIIKQINKQY